MELKKIKLITWVDQTYYRWHMGNPNLVKLKKIYMSALKQNMLENLQWKEELKNNKKLSIFFFVLSI
jgi:hypothetical protein